MNPRMAVGIAVLMVLSASVVTLAVAAPPPQSPPLAVTAFGDAPAHITDWTKEADAAGLTARTVVSDPITARHTPTPERTLLAIPQPRHAPSAEVQMTWHAHLEQGGSLLIMDAAGVTNRFLIDFGAAVTNRTILAADGEDPFTIAVHEPGNTAQARPILGRSLSSLLIEESDEWEPLLQSGTGSFLDIDQDVQVDQEDIPGPHVVAARLETPHGGQLIVVTSTSLFADHFFADPETRNKDRMMTITTAALPSGGTLLVDESHHGWAFPENQLVGAAQAFSLPSGTVPWAAGAVIITAAAALVVALKMSTVDRYKQHQLAKTAIEPHLLDHTDGFFASMAAAIRSRSGSDTGPTSNGDPRSKGDWLEQAANGNLRPEDRIRLIQLYESEVNQHA